MRLTDELFISKFSSHVLRDQKKPLVCYFNHPKAFNNAFWLPVTESVYFGKVDKRFFNPFVHSLDVTAHEFTHGFTEFSANLAYEFQSGSLNESLSDVFAIITFQFQQQTKAWLSNWLIGNGLIVNNPWYGTALRSMSAPGSAYKHHKLLGSDPQPAHMRDYKVLSKNQDLGGVHINSGIPNHAFYRAAIGLGGCSWEKAGKIWYKALLSASPRDDFYTFAGRTLIAAKDFSDDVVNAVGKAWQTVGVFPKDPSQLKSKL